MLIREKIFVLPFAVCLLLIHGAKSVLHPINATIKSSSLRLPTAVLPLTYFLHITSHIHQDILDFTGRVIIDLDVNTTTNEIILHADKLWGFKISLTDLRNNHKYENLDHSHSNQTDFLRIFSSSEPLNLVAGERYRLEIAFGGLIHQPHFGFYRNSYKDENNKTIPIGTTQFEPTSARLAFPCFDEPSFKSRFIISITHGSNYTAISNMPVDGEPVMSSNGEMITTTFRETPLMPTYLVAFVISNYQYISETSNNIEHRVFLPPHSIDRGHKALQNSIKSVNAIEKLFNVSYALPKLDHIRLEKTYGSAMENWGLITYSKKNFIPSHENHNWHAKVKLIIVQNHEIAHQWFGNMVSPKWWTYAWLNEGFATYFAYVVTELVYPDWRVGDFFIDNEVDVTFSWPIDHAMTHYVETEADIKSVFDVVVYQKASCFIKMFHHAIGHNTFIKGLTMFLTKFQYSVADEEDLFRVLQVAVNEDEHNLFKEVSTLPDIMHTWTHNQGIPIIRVSRNYGQGTITIHQRSNTKHKNETWWIPLNFASASNPNFNQTTADYILPPEEEVTINLQDINIEVSDSDWLMVNKQQTGLYYVVYDDYNLNLIAEALNSDHQKIHYLNRALLFRDLASALHKDLQSTEALCVILQYLRIEEDWMVWKSAADLILELRKNLYGSKAFDMYKIFIQDIIRPIFLKYQMTRKTEFAAADLSTRPKIVEVACHVDLRECLDYAKQLTIQYVFDGVKIDDAMSDIVMCQGIKYHDADEFRRLVDKLIQSTPDSEIYDDIIYSIRCVESKENLNYFLELIFGENSTSHIMSDYESMQYLAFIYVSNYFSRPVVLNFIMNNYQKLCTKSKAVLATLERISNYVSEDDGQKEEFLKLLANVTEILKDFEKINKHNIGSRIKSQEHFRKKHGDKLYVWLTRESQIIGQQERSTTSGESNQNLIPGVARYIVAAGLVSNLIGFV